jgi:glycosyltransferase involved in cell wall biosynthesis
MHIVQVISSLQCGGAQRVAVTLANAWAGRGFQVSILSLDGSRQPSFFTLDPAVAHRHMHPIQTRRMTGHDAQRVMASRFKDLSPVEHTIVERELPRLNDLHITLMGLRPDVVVSHIDVTNIRILLAMRGTGLDVVACEHSDPNCYAIGPPGWNRLRWRLYPEARSVVVLTDDARDFFSPEIRARARVIPNPVMALSDTLAQPSGSARAVSRTVLAVGRLAREKGFDILLDAFSRTAERHRGWHLEICGDGPLRAELQRRVRRLGLDGRVHLPGVTRQIEEAYRGAGLFVLSSRFEGFPNVLCEAMANGVPVVSFDCPSGPREIVRHGIDGLLVASGDVDALACALDRLMSNVRERLRMSARGPEVADRFSVERILARWSAIIGTGQRQTPMPAQMAE